MDAQFYCAAGAACRLKDAPHHSYDRADRRNPPFNWAEVEASVEQPSEVGRGKVRNGAVLSRRWRSVEQRVPITWTECHLGGWRPWFLNREHSAKPKPSWFGESVGHYENGELVIDTIGFAEHPYSFVDNYRTPHTKQLHTVERWRVAGGKEIEATVTVEDPGAFKAPWSGLVRWTKVNRAMMESICQENNLNYEKFLHVSEYPMPEAKTPDF